MTEIEKELCEKYGVSKVQRCSLDSAKKVLRLIEFIINKAKKDDEEKIDFIFTTDKDVKTQIIGGMLKTYECLTPQERNEVKSILES